MNSVIPEWVGHVCNVGKFPREGSMLQTWAVPFWFLRGVFMNSVIPEWVGHVCILYGKWPGVERVSVTIHLACRNEIFNLPTWAAHYGFT